MDLFASTSACVRGFRITRLATTKKRPSLIYSEVSLLFMRPPFLSPSRTAALSQARPTASSKRQLRNLLRFHPEMRAAHAIERDRHRRAKFEAGQIVHLSLVGVIHLAQLPPAPGTGQLPVASFSPYP